MRPGVAAVKSERGSRGLDRLYETARPRPVHVHVRRVSGRGFNPGRPGSNIRRRGGGSYDLKILSLVNTDVTLANDQPDRILMVRPSALGDVCRTAPAAASLRAAYPRARIEWVVQDTFVDAVRCHPAVDEVIPFSRSRYGDVWRSAGSLRDFRDWIGELRRREYDVAYDLQGLGRSALITYLSRARRRVGFASARELAWLGYTVRHPAPQGRHVVDQMVSIAPTRCSRRRAGTRPSAGRRSAGRTLCRTCALAASTPAS
jgi:hypothetical protein